MPHEALTNTDMLAAVLSGVSADFYFRGLVSAKLGPATAADEELIELIAGNPIFREICDERLNRYGLFLQSWSQQPGGPNGSSGGFSKELKQYLWRDVTADPRFEVVLKEALEEWNPPSPDRPESVLSKIFKWLLPFIKKPEDDSKGISKMTAALIATLVGGVVVGGGAVHIIETSPSSPHTDADLLNALHEIANKLGNLPKPVVNVQPPEQDYDLLKQQSSNLQLQLTRLEGLINAHQVSLPDNTEQLREICRELDSVRAAMGGMVPLKPCGDLNPGALLSPSPLTVSVTGLSNNLGDIVTALNKIITALNKQVDDNKKAFADISTAVHRPVLDELIPLTPQSTLKLQYQAENTDYRYSCTAELTLKSQNSRGAIFAVKVSDGCTLDHPSNDSDLAVGTGSSPLIFQVFANSKSDKHGTNATETQANRSKTSSLQDNVAAQVQSENQSASQTNILTEEVQISMDHESGKGNAPASWFRKPQSAVFRVHGPRGWTAIVK